MTDSFHVNGSSVLNHIDNGKLQDFQLSIVKCSDIAGAKCKSDIDSKLSTIYVDVVVLYQKFN